MTPLAEAGIPLQWNLEPPAGRGHISPRWGASLNGLKVTARIPSFLGVPAQLRSYHSQVGMAIGIETRAGHLCLMRAVYMATARVSWLQNPALNCRGPTDSAAVKLGMFTGQNYGWGPEYMEEYLRQVPPSKPREDFDDRNTIYAM